MNARELIARVVAPLVRATEGAVRPGPYPLPISGGWLPDGAPINWWQLGMNPQGAISPSAMVEACVSAYAQTVAMCPGDVWRATSKGGRERVTNVDLVRILKRPNSYTSISDFLMNATRYLYLEGNAYALALRNSRFEVTELHLMDSYLSMPQLSFNGEIFYHLQGNEVIARRLAELDGTTTLIVPQRDVLHLRLNTTERRWPFPLKGTSPLVAALQDIAATDAIKNQQIQFYMNQARPSAVLSTDLVLKREQVEELRQRWQEQAKGLDGCGPGGTPILTAGLKVLPWSAIGKDVQIAEIMKLSTEQIALAFRIPLELLGLAGGARFHSTEALMQFWLATSLGFALNHIEEAIGNFFLLKGQPDEYLELNTEALLRSMFKDRMEGLTHAVQGGILSPNEARNKEGYDDVKFGDEPRVQQQVVPLSAASAIQAPKSSSTGPHPPPALGPGAPPSAPPSPAPAKDHVARISRSLLRRAERYAYRDVDFIQDPATGQMQGSHPGSGSHEGNGSGDKKIEVVEYGASAVSSQFRSQVDKALKGIPAAAQKKISDYGAKVHVGVMLTDIMPEFKDTVPRGWPKGSTWDNAEGVYDRKGKGIYATELRKEFGTGKLVSGRTGTVLHESGHAFDSAMDNASTFSPGFTTAYHKDVAAIADADKGKLGYFLQKGQAGRRETFAEVFARVAGEGVTVDVTQYFPNTTTWMKEAMKLGAWPKQAAAA